MSDPNNKQENQIQRKPEEDIIWLILEASLNIGIVKENGEIIDNPSGKGKSIEGGKNRVFFLNRTGQNYKYYLGNFSIDKLENCKISNKKEVPVQGIGGDLAKNAKKIYHTLKNYTRFILDM